MTGRQPASINSEGTLTVKLGPRNEVRKGKDFYALLALQPGQAQFLQILFYIFLRRKRETT